MYIVEEKINVMQIIIFILVFLLFSIIQTRVYISINTFVKNFIFQQSVPKEFKMEKRFVVSLTTSPTRINKIKRVLDSIMNQDFRPDRIYLNLPRLFKRDNSKFKKIPTFITDNPLVFINWCTDIGPATKIIPALKHETDPESIIISIDDDILYGKNVLSNLVYYSYLYPDAVITGSSFLENNQEYTKLYKKIPIFSRLYYSQFLEGFSGVLYKTRFFQNFNSDYITQSPISCQRGDDLMLSNFLLSQNIPILSIENRSFITPLEYGLGADALHTTVSKGNVTSNQGNSNNYKSCIKWLKSSGNFHLKDIKNSYRYHNSLDIE
jgi:hypothetical protein